jgi:predicted DNA-binding protein YlxM (UPF0122 family)
MLNEITTISMLFDFYGNLLPERQKEFLRLYREENFSLSEIAQEFGLSRPGVHDSVKKAESALYAYEEKLKLLDRFQKTEQILKSIDQSIDQLIGEIGENSELSEKLLKIKNIADTLGE